MALYRVLKSGLIILGLQLCILLVTYIPSANAEAEDAALTKTFSESERVRYEVRFDFTYTDNNKLQTKAEVMQTSFDTGETITHTYHFEDSSLNPEHRIEPRKKDGSIALTPAGLKAYALIHDYASKSSIIYELDLTTKQLTKIADIQGLSVRLYASLGLYETYANPPYSNELPNIKEHQLYSIPENKPILPEGNYSFIEPIPVQKLNCAPVCQSSDYIVEGKAAAAKGAATTYLLSYGGKMNPVTLHHQFQYSDKTYSLALANQNGKLLLTHQHIGSERESSTLTWIKGNSKKVLLDVKGYINNFKTPSFSPSGRYMIVANEIRGKQLAYADSAFYVFDTSTMELVHKIKPQYKLYLLHLKWYNDRLIRLEYATSSPDSYPDFFYDIPTGTATVSRSFYKHQESFKTNSPYWDNFNYNGLITLDLPVSILVDNEPVRYSGQGAIYDENAVIIPIEDFAKQQEMTVQIQQNGLKLTKGNLQTEISYQKAVKKGDTWFVPVRELLPLGYKLESSSKSVVKLASVK